MEAEERSLGELGTERGWLVVVVGNAWQQLNITTTEFLYRWTRLA